MTSDGTRIERFLAHLDVLTEGVEPEFWPVESTKPGMKGLTAITHPDVPEPGFLTAITYGLSLADHELWRHGKPELCISVRSTDRRWAQAAAFIAEQLRGECPFQYGDTVNFGEPISTESAMDAFFVFSPAVLGREDTRVEVGDDHPVNIVGLYPIHRSEREFIKLHGLDAFWNLDWDPYDVARQPAV
jgi:hypothetical protein